MIRELAQVDVKPGTEEAFEAAVAKAVPLFARQRGYRSLQLLRVVERPQRYRLLVDWDSVEDHTVHFRGSPDFQEWRKLAGGFFATPPVVDHMHCVLSV